MTVRIPIISTFNAKGIKDATKQFNKLGHSVNGALKIAAVEEFARRSIKAFAENQKGVALLTNTLKNLGQEFMAVGVVKFIDDLTLATGKTKEELIPAFQGLFIATGSVTKAQEALKLAMDVSAGTTKDLNTVQIALSKAYLGNTTSLTRLGAGLSKTLLKTGDMEKITAQLAATFKGNASIAADTFSGKMDRLKASINDAQEIIGGAMVNSLAKFAGSNGVGGAQKAVKGLGDEIGYIVTGIGDMAAAIKPLLPLLTAVGLAMLAISNPFTAGAIGVALVAGEAAKIKDRNYYAAKKTVSYGGGRGAGGYTTGLGYTRTAMQSPGDRAKIDAGNAKLAKAKKDELALLTAKNKTTKEEAQMKADQAALDKLKAKFDLERIGLNAALNNATDEETKARIRAQIAILDETGKTAQAANDALVKAQADKLANEVYAADVLKYLAVQAMSASTGIIKWLSALEYSRERFGNAGVAPILPSAAPVMPGTAPVMPGTAPVMPGTAPTAPITAPTAPITATSTTAIAAVIAATDAAVAFIESDSIGSIAAIPAIIDAIGSTASDFVDATNATQAAADAIDAQATSVAAIIEALAATIPGETYAAIVDSINSIDIADALATYIGSDKATKDNAVTITINDNTSGLIAVVADAVLTNNRYGNSLVPTGTIAG